MHRAAPNIYTSELFDLSAGLQRDLCALAGTTGACAMYIGNGHAAWEAALANVAAPGMPFWFWRPGVSGTDGPPWPKLWGCGCDDRCGFSAPPDLMQGEAALRDDPALKAVMLCHVDTASGLRADIAPIRGVIDRLGHRALLMVDCIASLGCDAYEMDRMGADVTVAACQKG